LLKSDLRVSRSLELADDELEEVELEEEALSCAIRLSSSPVKLEYAEPVVELVEEDVVEEEEESPEEDWDFRAENRSCISLPKAWAGFCVESVEELESVPEVDEEEVLDAAEPLDEVDEDELELKSGGGPPGGGDMERPIWPSVCITLCMNPLCSDPDPSLAF
jgi:hypothetical protein